MLFKRGRVLCFTPACPLKKHSIKQHNVIIFCAKYAIGCYLNKVRFEIAKMKLKIY